ncbi:hypothetical protein [Roseovarius sp. D0-M9]|uniref:hypothetical protein n=1 Tax=Roseovarius sp. D0-M9 TaxID=3127117 RepID=UPI00300FE237
MKPRDVQKHQLFWETEIEFERFDEWSEPKAFAFGDMDMLEEKNLGQIAENYFRCADVLIERVLKNDLEDFVAQFPIIYLTRHAVEVMLKRIVLAQSGEPAGNEHSLHKLANMVSGVDPWALRRIQELNAIDPNSEDLRYGGIGERAPAFIGTELRFFRDAMFALFDHLRAVADASERKAVS